MDSVTETTDVAASESTHVSTTKSSGVAATTAEASAATTSARFRGRCQQSGRQHGRCNRCYQSFHDFTPVQQRRTCL
jgi:hypothetical protein